MTVAEIKDKLMLETIKHETAVAIRELLDAAEAKYDQAGGDWSGDDVESVVLELVTDC